MTRNSSFCWDCCLSITVFLDEVTWIFLRWLKTGDADEEEIYTDSSAFLKVRKYKLQFQMFAFWRKKKF